MNNRILLSKNGVITDLSTELNDFKSGVASFSLKTGEDCLYIGSKLPFNHIYIRPLVPNVKDAKVLVEYWDGNLWVPVVETIDNTRALKNAGHLQFVPNRDKSWARQDTTYNGRSITGLDTVTIYDRYWVKLSYNADLSGEALNDDEPPVMTDVDMSLSWMGNVFSNDLDLKGEMPELIKQKYLTAFEVGKTSWDEQHVIAAGLIIQDLVNMGVIIEKGQILDWREFTSASIQKVAEIIFNVFGDDYVDQSVAARKEYLARIDKRHYIVDSNNNAVEETAENFDDQGFFTR